MSKQDEQDALDAELTYLDLRQDMLLKLFGDEVQAVGWVFTPEQMNELANLSVAATLKEIASSLSGKDRTSADKEEL